MTRLWPSQTNPFHPINSIIDHNNATYNSLPTFTDMLHFLFCVLMKSLSQRGAAVRVLLGTCRRCLTREARPAWPCYGHRNRFMQLLVFSYRGKCGVLSIGFLVLFCLVWFEWVCKMFFGEVIVLDRNVNTPFFDPDIRFPNYRVTAYPVS